MIQRELQQREEMEQVREEFYLEEQEQAHRQKEIVSGIHDDTQTVQVVFHNLNSNLNLAGRDGEENTREADDAAVPP